MTEEQKDKLLEQFDDVLADVSVVYRAIEDGEIERDLKICAYECMHKISREYLLS